MRQHKQAASTDSSAKGEDKLAALRAQKRQLGLCMKCGEKWGRQHKCPTQIPLHILEEFLDAVNSPDVYEDNKDLGSSDEELLSISFVATEGIQWKRIMRLQSMIKNQELLLLVDPGSSSTFISKAAVQNLQYIVQEAPLVHITAANGGTLPSSGIIPELTWYTKGILL